jgi:Domain of unknown function (DUF927)
MMHVVSMPSWQFDKGHVSQQRGDGPDGKELVRILNWSPEVLEVVLRHDDEGQDILTRSYLIRVGSHSQLISHPDLMSGAAWQHFPAAGGINRTTINVLGAIVTELALDAPKVASRATMTATGLALPPDRYLPAGYGRQTGTAEGLTRLVDALAPHPYPSILLGLSAVSHLVRPAGLQPAWFTLLGDSTTAKTTTLRAIAALWGSRHAVRAFSGTVNGIPGHLRDLCVLPAFWDELGASDMRPSQTLALIMSTCEGAQRSARNRDDTPRKSGTWHSFCFASGNKPLTSATSPGLGARLVELPFTERNPAIPPALKSAVQLATNAPDAGGSWIPYATSITPDDFHARLTAVLDMPELIPTDDRVGLHIVRHMAAGLVGVQYLAQATDNQEIWGSALDGAAAIMAATADRLADLGAGDPGEELLMAITDDMIRRPEAWARAQGAEDRRVDFLGWVEGRDIFVRVPALEEIAERAKVESLKVSLRELADADRLITTKGKGLRRVVRIGEISAYVYCLRMDAPLICRGCREPMALDDGTGLHPSCEAPAAPRAAAPVRTLSGDQQPAGGPATPGKSDSKLQNVTVPAPAAPVQEPLPENPYGQVPLVQLQAFSRIIADDAVPDDELWAGLLNWRGAVRVGTKPVDISGVGAGMTGALVYKMLQGLHKSIPPLMDRVPLPEDLRFRRPSTTANWIHPKAAERLEAAGGVVVGVDVNAQFLAAASSTEYPTGEPVITPWDDAVSPKLMKMPGYVRITEPSGAPLPYPAGSFLPMPVARYLLELGRLPAADVVVTFRESRRHLSAWSRVFRDARASLLERAPDDIGAAIALRAVKTVSNRFLSGWMVTDQNRTEFMRPEWADQTIGTSRANAMRAIGKLQAPTLLGVFTDTVFFAGGAPDGLTYTNQPGKWKVAYTANNVLPAALSSPQTLFKVVGRGES